MNRDYLEGKEYIVFLNATAACKCKQIVAQITALGSPPLLQGLICSYQPWQRLLVNASKLLFPTW